MHSNSIFNNNNSTASFSSLAMCSAIGLFTVEFVLHLVSIAISMFNFILVLRSKLLHANLKWILLTQSVCIAASELCRFIFTLSLIPTGNIYAHKHFARLLASWYLYMNTLRIFVSYVLLAERTLATVLFRRYTELYTGPGLNIACLITMLCISYGVQLTQNNSPRGFNSSTLISICILFSLQIIALILLAIIYIHNKKKYLRGNVLALNQRFQLSENIRTLKQLSPTFVFYTLIVLLIYGIKFVFYFGWIVNIVPTKIAFMCQTLLLASANIGIELTVITHHPLLKRRAVQWILNALKFCRCYKNQIVDAQQQSMPPIGGKPKSLFGNELIIHRQNQTDHFDMLNKAWQR